MKHSEQRQAGAEYDQEKDDRLVKASYDFNLQFAAKFTAPSVANNGGGSSGSSSAHASAPAAAGSTAAQPAVVARPVRAAAVRQPQRHWRCLQWQVRVPSWRDRREPLGPSLPFL